MAFQPLADHSRRPPWLTDVAAPITPNIPYKEAIRTTPVRAPERADWTVPLMLSILTGALVGMPVGGAIGYAPGGFNVAGGAALGFIVCVSGVWLWRLRAFPALLVRIEKITGLDVSPDYPESPPPTPPPSVHIEVETGPGRMALDDLPVPGKRGVEGLASFCHDLGAGGNFSERAASEHGYTRGEWQEFRDKFVAHGFAMWDNPANRQGGVTLLAIGRLVCKRTAQQLESLR